MGEPGDRTWTGRRPADQPGWQPKCQPWRNWGSREPGALAEQGRWDHPSKPHSAQPPLASSPGGARSPPSQTVTRWEERGRPRTVRSNREAADLSVQTESGPHSPRGTLKRRERRRTSATAAEPRASRPTGSGFRQRPRLPRPPTPCTHPALVSRSPSRAMSMSRPWGLVHLQGRRERSAHPSRDPSALGPHPVGGSSRLVLLHSHGQGAHFISNTRRPSGEIWMGSP